MKKVVKKFIFPIATLTVLLLIPSLAHAIHVPGHSLVPVPVIGAAVNAVKNIGNILTDIAANAVGWAVFVVTYIIATVVGALIGFVAFFVEVALQLNSNIVRSNAVQSGFKIATSVANLGFVAAIIVIAIATILRSQTYGIKKILWKLVVAALLVNFSLVIAGVIINFADGLTLYFLKAASPDFSYGPFTGFANSLAGAFAPHRAFLSFNNETGHLEGINPAIQGAAGPGQSLAAIITPLFSLGFVSLFLILILLTLIALFVMLIIRYVYLSVLLILMPFAWLLWIFPGFQSNWSKWWHNFLRWTFFAPIMVFFLYLAISTAGVMSGNNAGNDPRNPIGAYAGNNFASLSTHPILAGLQNFVGGFTNQILGTVLQMIVVLALALGGLFAANSLSITGAKVAYGAATGAVKAVGGWAGTKGSGAGARLITQKPTRPPPPAATGVKGAFQKIIHPFRVGAYHAQRVTQATAEKIVPKAMYTDIKRFGEAAKKSPGLFRSVYGGAKSGSGIFKAGREKGEAMLNRLYTKKSALQGELDLLHRAAPGALNPTQQQRLIDLPGLITEVDTKINDLEQQSKP